MPLRVLQVCWSNKTNNFFLKREFLNSVLLFHLPYDWLERGAHDLLSALSQWKCWLNSFSGNENIDLVVPVGWVLRTAISTSHYNRAAQYLSDQNTALWKKKSKNITLELAGLSKQFDQNDWNTQQLKCAKLGCAGVTRILQTLNTQPQSSTKMLKLEIFSYWWWSD